MADQQRHYTQDEVNAILRRALKSHDPSTDLAHDDLLAAAQEVGIERPALDRAIAEVQRDQATLALRDQWRSEKKQALTSALFTFVWVNLLIGAIDFFTAGGPWFFWVLIPWGLLLCRRALDLYRGPTSKQLAKIEERRLRAERHRELQRQFEHGAVALGTAVEQGAQFLIDQLAASQKRRLSDGNGNRKPESPAGPPGKPR